MSDIDLQQLAADVQFPKYRLAITDYAHNHAQSQSWFACKRPQTLERAVECL